MDKFYTFKATEDTLTVAIFCVGCPPLIKSYTIISTAHMRYLLNRQLRSNGVSKEAKLTDDEFWSQVEAYDIEDEAKQASKEVRLNIC